VVVNNLAAPGSFPLALSVAVLTGVILGGLGSLMGAVWGAALIVLIPTWSEDLSNALNLSQNVEANLSIAIYGLILIGVMLAAPRGLQGAIERLVGLGRGLRDNQQRSRAPERPGKEEEKSEP
jgi:branched-chain amino acid transport system permease protein